jgi:MoaA/NifB/PqqE/SkfB family radical SAM enzyme
MILTNGTLLNTQKINALIDYNVKHVGFSIDGTRQSHDNIRGVTGAYDKTISSIEILNEIKRDKGLSIPRIGINFVITNETMFDMQSIAEVAQALRVDVLSFSYVNYISERKLKKHKRYLKSIYPDLDFCYWDGFLNNHTSLDSEELTKVIRRLKKQYGDSTLKISFSYDLIQDEVDRWYNSDEVILDQCNFVNNCFFILPNGDFPLCDFIRFPVGNVKERSLEELWNDERARNFRTSVGKQLLPGCERCCQLSAG